MIKYHLTDEGPKRCSAEPGNCPLGGEHFGDIEKARAALEVKLARNEFLGVLKKSSAELPELDVAGLKPGIHQIGDVEVDLGGLSHVKWRSDCATCQNYGQGAFAPSHNAMPNCKSGGKPHCSCNGCF